MNTSQKIGKLYEHFGQQLRVWHRKKFLIPVTWPGGWITIRENADSWSVLTNNSKKWHHPFLGLAFAADFCKYNGARRVIPPSLTGAWKSDFSMWTLSPIRDEEEAARIFSRVRAKIDATYHYYRLGVLL